MRSKQKKLFTIFVLFTVLFILGAAQVFAKEDAIPSINLEVILQSDGSAVITEIWDVRGVSSGTEYYKALNNMDGMNVHSLAVWDESGTQYKTLDGWNTKLSREEKSGTCGILKTSDGYELCWGIGSYGNHQYTIQYTVEGLVKDYGDYAGFYHQFISELSNAPESAYIKIRMADTSLTANNARIWAYGFTGEAEIGSDGSLNVFSSEALGGGDYVNVLCRFDRSLFPLASAADMSFEKLQESAENKNSDTALYIVLAVLGAVIVMTVIPVVFFSSRYKLADGTAVRLPGKKQIDTNWSVPFGGSIPAVYSAMLLLRKGISCEKLMGAYLIRWQEAGYIRIERESERTIKRTKEEAIIFSPDKIPDPGVERSLYDILTDDIDHDGFLWTSDIEKRADTLYKKLTAWAAEVKREGEKVLIHSGAAATNIKGTVRFTVSGFEQAVKLLGFRKYLMELHMQREDRPVPGELWGDYLVFATLFNVGEQVLESMKALDPAYFDTFAGMYGCNAFNMIYLVTMTNHISSAATPTQNTDGIGGAAGSVGGGGFSGGGGGGSR
ncbi:DUF2207 domain-containing protein [Clostridium sp. WB02_MRS01]|uniref:DUF2207 domain-containing protein n=1 Tax=Clostridium sp. WB02_MRS01 TaxID=2605777 RepID=UPI0012B21239|nr:DUF2207 domain-containing protein [Clostridium sp. WB02_MRS01]MSS09133.1 DUF2207 domain-containing protein [Clostridium sp. WB02_MRS01]